MIIKMKEKTVHSFTVNKDGTITRNEDFHYSGILKSTETAKKMVAEAFGINPSVLVVTDIVSENAYFDIPDAVIYEYGTRTTAPRKKADEATEADEATDAE